MFHHIFVGTPSGNHVLCPFWVFY